MSFTPIDLSRLPAPNVLEPLDFEVILAERKAELIAAFPAAERPAIAARLALESEPLTKLLQENSYRELIWRQRVNEAAQATMLAFAQGADLEQLAANFNVARLVITPANPSAVPPVAAVLEPEESLRERTQMAMEGLSTAGPRNSYIFHARSSDGRVADASCESPSPAVVVVTVQSALGNGAADQALLNVVASYLSDDERRPVADRLTVQGAQILEYSIEAELTLVSSGPEAELIRQAAIASLQALINQRRRLGVEVSESAVHAALHVEGVRRVDLIGWTDITPLSHQAAYCTSYSVTVVA